MSHFEELYEAEMNDDSPLAKYHREKTESSERLEAVVGLPSAKEYATSSRLHAVWDAAFAAAIANQINRYATRDLDWAAENVDAISAAKVANAAVNAWVEVKG